MSNYLGTISRGIRTPIIKAGDDLTKIVVDSIFDAANDPEDGFRIKDRDIVAITESVVARAQNNYATVDDIAEDIRNKFPSGEFGIIFPIFSRNRFSICLKGIAKGAKKITLMLAFPSDEVGNSICDLRNVDMDICEAKGLDPTKDVLTLDEFREIFGYTTHLFTGVDYISLYKNIIEEAGAECEIIFSNNPYAILNYTKNVLCCLIHDTNNFKNLLKIANNANIVLSLEDILNTEKPGRGYNAEFGLLGSNKATEDTIKLFPNDGRFLADIRHLIFEKTGKNVEVMIYGDGAFKDPVGKIWELADPVVSPYYTEGLAGTPNELKIKYLADNDYSDLNGEQLISAIKDKIHNKENNLVGQMESQGTTPRRYVDLIGSLCDLTSGSGDKGTPVVYIQNYFENYSSYNMEK